MDDEIIIAAIFLIIGAAFVLMPIHFILLRNKMLQIGIRERATIIDVKVGRATRSKSGQMKCTYTYTLEYMADYTNITTTFTSTTIDQDYAVGDTMSTA